MLLSASGRSPFPGGGPAIGASVRIGLTDLRRDVAEVCATTAYSGQPSMHLRDVAAAVSHDTRWLQMRMRIGMRML